MEMGAGDSYRELDEKGEVQPLHELWEGDNNFCCDGRCMLGPSLGHLAFVLILALGSTGYFVAVICPGSALAIPFTAAAFATTVLNVAVLAAAAFTEPGIIVRQSQTPAISRIYLEAADPLLRWKYCSTCNTYRPPRAKHCSFSDNCIIRFDHFCPWVGNSVGARNYRFFFAFLVATELQAGFLAVGTLFILGADDARGSFSFSALTHALRDDPWPLLLLAVALVAFFAVLSLLVLHCFLISANQTTNENANGHFDGRENPFSRGLCANWHEALLAPRPPSQLPPMHRRVHVSADEEGFFLRPAIAVHQDHLPPDPPAPEPGSPLAVRPREGDKARCTPRSPPLYAPLTRTPPRRQRSPQGDEEVGRGDSSVGALDLPLPPRATQVEAPGHDRALSLPPPPAECKAAAPAFSPPPVTAPSRAAAAGPRDSGRGQGASHPSPSHSPRTFLQVETRSHATVRGGAS